MQLLWVQQLALCVMVVPIVLLQQQLQVRRVLHVPWEHSLLVVVLLQVQCAQTVVLVDSLIHPQVQLFANHVLLVAIQPIRYPRHVHHVQ